MLLEYLVGNISACVRPLEIVARGHTWAVILLRSLRSSIDVVLVVSSPVAQPRSLCA